MNRYFLLSFSFLPVLVIAGVVVMAIARPGPAVLDAEGEQREMALYAEVKSKLAEHYDGELSDVELLNGALKGLAEGTGDPFTRVLAPVETRQQDIDLKGQFSGIGVTVQPNADGSVRVTNVVSYSGADKAGILADDVLVEVDGVSILDQSLESTMQRIKSDKEGSVVKLVVLRGGDPDNGRDARAQRLTFDVVRSRIESWSVHDVHIEQKHNRRFGYLHISEFVENTFDPQFKDAVSQLTSQGAEGIIIDLRGNSGGRVTSATDVADGLIAAPDALIAFTRSSRESNRAHDKEIRTADDAALTALPVVVLIDDSTASAAELLTAALKDHGRACVIGVRSYGKGVVQTIFKLQSDPRYSINITTTQYFTPLGRQVQKGENVPGGIVPDLPITYKQGEKSRVHARLTARKARYNRDQAREASQWWDYEDRMLSAALDFLAGVPVVVQ